MTFESSKKRKQRGGRRPLAFQNLSIEPLESRQLLAAAPVLGNNPPMLAAIADMTVDQGATVSFTATATDDDLPAGAQLTFQLDPDETPTGATIDRLTGAFNWTAPVGATGQFRFVILVSDRPPTGVAGARATSDAEEFIVNVIDVNQPPVNTVPGAQNVNEDATLTFSDANTNRISVADPDAGTGALRVTLSVAAGSGTLTLGGVAGLDFTGGQGDGSADESMSFTGTADAINAALAGLQYSPGNFNGNTTLTIVTNDQGNTGGDGPKSDTDTVAIAVAAQNDAPVVTVPGAAVAFVEDEAGHGVAGVSVADIDAGSADVQVTFSVVSGRILISDALPGGLTAAQISGNGSKTVVVTAPLAAINATLSADNGLNYAPDADFFGNDTLTVAANDQGNSGAGGALSDSEQLTLTVAAVNDAPTATAPAGPINVNEDTQIFVTGLDVNDLDAGAGNVTVTLSAPNGILTFSDAVAGGVVAAQISGQSTNTVTITAPVAAIRTTLGNASGLAYQGALNFNGADTLTIAINDNGNTGGGALSDSKSVNINVSAVNDAPVASVPGTPAEAQEETSTNLTGLDVNDADSGTANITVTLAVVSGTITLNSAVAGGVTPEQISGQSTNTVTITAPLAAIRTTLGANGAAYLGNQNFFGADTLTLSVNDGGASGAGGALTDSKTLTINVANVNDVSTIAGPNNIETIVNTSFTLNAANNATVSVADIDSGNVSVLIAVANAGAISLSGLTGLTFTQGDGNSDSTLEFSGTLTNVNAALDGMVYQPAAGFTGASTITITVDDGATSPPLPQKIINVQVASNANQAPSIIVPAGPINLAEDNAAGAPITGIGVSDPDAAGDDVQLTLVVTNGTLQVRGDVVGGVTAAQISNNGTGTVVVTAPLAAINATLGDATGVVYRGSLNFNGNDTLTATINDLGNNGSGGPLSDSDTVPIAVSAVNDAPTVTLPETVAATEDTDATITGASVADVDAGSSPVTVVLAVQNGVVRVRTDVVGGLGAADVTGNDSASVTLTGSVAAINATLAADGGLVYRANLNFNGSDTLSAEINDGGATGSGGALTGSDTSAITIAGVNDAPNLVLTPPSTTADQFSTVTMTASATDPENNTVTFQIDPEAGGRTGPAGSNLDTATINPDTGAFSFAPNMAGTYTFRILATDNGGPPTASDAETFTITVNPVNLPPNLQPRTVDDAPIGNLVTITPLVDNPEGAIGLTYQIIEILTSPAGSNADTAVIDPDTGLFTFTPNTPGTYCWLVSVTDSDLPASEADTEIYTINVADTNDAPVITVPALGPEILEDQAAPVFITGLNMTDADAGTANVRLTLSVLHGGVLVSDVVTDGVTTAQITGNGTATVTIEAPLLAIQNTLASGSGVAYTPEGDYFGPETLTVTGNDLGNTGGTPKIDTELLALNITAVNDPPSFTAGADQEVAEDAGAQTIAGWATNISKGPANESAQTLTFEIVNDNTALFSVAPAIAEDGTLSFTPAANANGLATLSVLLRDNGGGNDASAVATLKINILAVNDPPAFTVGADQSVDEDAPAQTVAGFITGISPGPTDESAQTVAFSVSVDNPDLFSVAPAIAADGTLTYTPAANANGVAVLTITGKDDGGGADSTQASGATITINAVNDPPSFEAPSSVTVDEDAGPQTINWAASIGVGPANESTQTAQFEVVNNNPELFDGAVTISPTGVLSFTPAADANGNASLQVVLRDDGGGTDASAPLTLTIGITPVNDAPAFTVGADHTVDEDAPAQTVENFITAVSPGPANESAQTVSFSVAVDNPALFAVAPAIAADGTLTYTPAANANGVAVLTITGKDTGGTANPGDDDDTLATGAKITINAVNDLPVAVNDNNVEVVTDSTGVTVSVLTNDSTADAGETLLIVGKTDGDMGGTVTIAPDGLSLQYTPATGFQGTETFTYTINDGTPGNDATATVTVKVGDTNQAPDVAGPTTATTDEDQEVLFSQAINGNGISVTDPDAAALPIRVAITATNGRVTLFQTTGLAFTLGDGASDNELAFGGSQADINAALEGMVFQPNADFSGLAGLLVLSFDNGNTGIGGEKSDALETVITVNSLNDPPSASNDLFDVLQDSLDNDLNVLGNDTFLPDTGETLTIVDVSSGDQGGTVTIINGGTALRYTPAPGFTGTEEFTYEINDGTIGSNSTATVTVNVQAINDPPSITDPGNQTTLEDAPLVFNDANANAISVADPDSGASPIEVSLEVAGGALSLGSTAGLQLDGFTGADGDGSDGTLTFRGSLADVNAALLGLTYTPAANFNGATALSVAVSDLGATGVGGTKSDTATVLIDVTAVNDPPTFDVAQTTITVDEDAAAQTLDNFFSNIGVGPANESSQDFLTADFVVDHPELFSVQPASGGVDGLVFTPAPNAHGTAVVTITAMDNGGTANGGVDTTVKQITIVINSVNDAPTMAPQTVTDAALNGALNIPVTSGDVDGDTLTYSLTLVSAPEGSNAATAAVDSATGAFTFTPNTLGSYAFTVRATDNGTPSMFTEAAYNITVVDGTLPTITAGLTNDSGASASDGVTNDATVGGTTSDNIGVTLFEAAVDASAFSDQTSALDGGGAFTFTRAQLEAILGAALSQGGHNVHLRATDAQGNVRNVTVSMTFDTIAPAAPVFALDDLTRVDPGQPFVTILDMVTLQGFSSQGAEISLIGTALTTQANPTTGLFMLPNVPVNLGGNILTVRSTDLAGNFSEANNTITRNAPPPAPPGANDAALDSLLGDDPFGLLG